MISLSARCSSSAPRRAIGRGILHHAAAKRIAARHQRRPRRGAERRRAVELRQPRPFGRHAVEVRRFELRMAVAAEVAVAEVVGQDEDDVRAAGILGANRLNTHEQRTTRPSQSEP